MTLNVYTAPLRARDRDRLDVTRSGVARAVRLGRPAPGAPFAPSAELVYPTKAWSANAAALEAAGLPLAVDLDRVLGEAYAALYRAEMRVSAGLCPDSPRWGPLEALAWARGVRQARAAWVELLERPRVVLVCHCPHRDQCHRGLLADLLAAMGARDLGELEAPERGRGNYRGLQEAREELRKLPPGEQEQAFGEVVARAWLSWLTGAAGAGAPPVARVPAHEVYRRRADKAAEEFERLAARAMAAGTGEAGKAEPPPPPPPECGNGSPRCRRQAAPPPNPLGFCAGCLQRYRAIAAAAWKASRAEPADVAVRELEGQREALACPDCGPAIGVLSADLSIVCAAVVVRWERLSEREWRREERPGCGLRLYLCGGCGLRNAREDDGQIRCPSCGKVRPVPGRCGGAA